MRIHFIAIGGAIMHNLAITLHEKGHQITGSDDHIKDPARSNLSEKGLLPPQEGWDPQRIQPELDAVILGMHARPDNPELLRAQELGLQIYSFPELIYRENKHKNRFVVAGSHGKTTITAMVMHVLDRLKRKFDYLVGARVPGFRHSVKLTTNSPLIVLEGDEYLTSPLDTRPKFLWYEPHVALISGLSWDHINVYPTYEAYKEQFERFIDTIQPQGTLIYNAEDVELTQIVQANKRKDLKKIAYTTPEYSIVDNKLVVKWKKERYALQIIGRHNVQNLEAARKICEQLDIKPADFFTAMENFRGAQKRLEPLWSDDHLKVFRDFAHAPSKVQATVSAIKEQFPDWQVLAFLELHTFSSLNKGYLKQYRRTLADADRAFLFIDPDALERKQLPDISEQEIRQFFGRPSMELLHDTEELENKLPLEPEQRTVILLMSSGNFGGFSVKNLLDQLRSHSNS